MNNPVLTEADNEPDYDKDLVITNSSKDVEFVINLSSSNHVEDIQQHKGVEDDSEVSRGTKFFL